VTEGGQAQMQMFQLYYMVRMATVASRRFYKVVLIISNEVLLVVVLPFIVYLMCYSRSDRCIWSRNHRFGQSNQNKNWP
jgi:hypothetical protein